MSSEWDGENTQMNLIVIHGYNFHMGTISTWIAWYTQLDQDFIPKGTK